MNLVSNIEGTISTGGVDDPQEAACRYAPECRQHVLPPLGEHELFQDDNNCLKAGQCERYAMPASETTAVPLAVEQPPLPEDPKEIQAPTYTPPEDPSVTAPFSFLFLGFNRGTFYFWSVCARQVVVIRAGEMSPKFLLQLAPITFWEGSFPASRAGANWNAASTWLIQRSYKIGIYDPGRIRGRGAWEDDGRSVLHLGDCLLVDGCTVPLEDFETTHIYEADAPLETGMTATPIGAADANRFAKLCELLSWEVEISARLFAGWCVLAPICGALRWRPHGRITGPSGSGKSWCADNIVRPIVGPCALIVQSNTTEAGIRQTVGSDARPVLFDEAESEDQAGQTRMRKVLELMRQASSDNAAAIIKGGSGGKAQMFRIRSMFLLSSIGAAEHQKADLSRITQFPLKINNAFDRAEQFAHLQRTAHELLTTEFCAGLRSRTVRLIPVIRKNAEVFARAASGILGTARAGDQYGALLAGAYSLFSAGEIDEKSASKWISEQDWGEAIETGTDTDERRCMSVILEAVIRVDTGSRPEDVGIGEAAHAVAFGSAADCRVTNLAAALGRHGLKVDVAAGALFISNTHTAIGRVLRETPWAVNWSQIIARLPGAERITKTVRFGGTTSKAVAVPVTVIFPECD